MKLDDCRKCEHHKSERRGLVLCAYWEGELDARPIAKTIDGESEVFPCPREHIFKPSN